MISYWYHNRNTCDLFDPWSIQAWAFQPAACTKESSFSECPNSLSYHQFLLHWWLCLVFERQIWGLSLLSKALVTRSQILFPSHSHCFNRTTKQWLRAYNSSSTILVPSVSSQTRTNFATIAFTRCCAYVLFQLYVGSAFPQAPAH